MKAAGIGLDRKILSDLAITEEAAFKANRRSGESRAREQIESEEGGVGRRLSHSLHCSDIER